MKSAIRILLIGAALAASMAASAQYQWIDKDGRHVFSDSPPPADVPDKDILSQPQPRANARGAAASAAEAARAASAAQAAASAPSGVDKSLEEKKKQAEDEAAAKKKAEEAKVAAAKADNCKRAMSGKATLDSGQRVATTNAKTGEREYLDDAQRASEAKRLQGIISSDCPK